MEKAHISALVTKHAGLEARLAEEARRPMPDPVRIRMIKKQKLRIKEALAQ